MAARPSSSHAPPARLQSSLFLASLPNLRLPQQQTHLFRDYDLSELPQTKSGLDDALKMPSFQLNVRNQGPNKLLLFLVAMQLMTNIGLIAILWHKLG